MCVVICKDTGVKALDAEYFSRAWDSNPDGAGVVWKHKDDEVYFQKGFMNKQDFLEKLKEINQDDTSFIAHFRIKSVGKICAENTHPFVMNYVTFAHNGTLAIQPFNGLTDSETFGLKFLKNRKMSWIKKNQELLEMALGTSKFAIMDNETGEILVLNKNLGQEKDGAWFSNGSAFPKTTTPTTYNDYNYDDDWYKNWGKHNKSYNSTMTFLPDKLLGTKKYYRNQQSYSKEQKGMIWTNTNILVLPDTSLVNFVVNKRGLWEPKKDAQIPADIPECVYKDKDPVYNAILGQQVRLNRAIDTYHKGKYKTAWERDSVEDEIQAMNVVLALARRLVRANKVVNVESLTAFYKKLAPGMYDGPYSFRNTIEDEIVELCILEDAIANPAVK